MNKNDSNQSINKNYPNDWIELSISQIGDVIGGGTPSTKIDSYYPGKIAWITPRDLSNHKEVYISKGERSISEEGLKNSSARLMPKETVLFTSRAPIGYVSISKNEVSTNQGFKSIICNNKAHNKFIYYWLKQNKVMIESLASGSTFREISGNVLKSIKIILPSVKEQKSISNILFNLDSKIELLQKQNDTLEKIGQEIFKQWFVDFEFPNEEGKPYKSSGGKMIESELRKIPEGWSVGKLGDYAESISGCSYTSKGLENSEKALVTLKSISVNGFSQDGFKEYTGEYKEKHVVNDGDIVVAHTDLTQNRIILGKPAVVRDLGSYEVMIASMDLSIVRPKELLNRPYIFYLLNTNMFHGHAQGYANGTTVIHLSRKAIPEFTFFVPIESVLAKFKELSNYLFDKININQREILNLQKTRDILLLKLMSGQIRVPLEVRE